MDERTPLLQTVQDGFGGNSSSINDPSDAIWKSEHFPGGPVIQNEDEGEIEVVVEGKKDESIRWIVFELIEGKSTLGQVYEIFMIVLIVVNVIAFIVGTLFVTQYNPAPWADPEAGICNLTCDMWLFGNYRNNGISRLFFSTSTSVLELFTVFVFTVDYMLRLWTVDLIPTTTSTTSTSTPTGSTSVCSKSIGTKGKKSSTAGGDGTPTPITSSPYAGWYGRLRWIPTFFSVVDLISIVPFYIDAFLLTHYDFVYGTAFVRMFRLLRMMKVEGRYDTALTMVDDVYRAQKSILVTAAFVGLTTWMSVSALYYLAERNNPNFIYCPACAGDDNDSYDIASFCTIDPVWGSVNCTIPPSYNNNNNNNNNNNTTPHCSTISPCYNLYESIPSASYYALLNLFGEFPHITDHSTMGKIVATLTAVVAVAVFALPVGIIGNGFETVIEQRRQEQFEYYKRKRQDELMALTQAETDAIANSGRQPPQQTSPLLDFEERTADYDDAVLTANFVSNNDSVRGRLYNLLHSQVAPGARILDYFLNALIILTAFTFMLETTTTTFTNSNNGYSSYATATSFFDYTEWIAVVAFTIEYILRVYSCAEDPKYSPSTSDTTSIATFDKGDSNDGNNNQTYYTNNNSRCGGNRFKYMTTFLAIVDLLSFLPYWFQKFYLVFASSKTSSSSNTGTWLSELFMLLGPTSKSMTDDNISIFISSLRLLRILRFERYTHAFTTFDDVFRRNRDVLAVTAFTAVLCWVFFSAILYVTERDSYNREMADNYSTIPNSMWITLLNLAGEAPLSEYTIPGKFVTAIVGVFATGIFGIPIGLLGAGFEEIVAQENQDNTAELEIQQPSQASPFGAECDNVQSDDLLRPQQHDVGSFVTTTSHDGTSNGSSTTSLETMLYKFLNGDSYWGQQFELTIYGFIFLAVAVGCWQTVEGQENSFSEIEWFTVILFTIEYILRLIAVGADPKYNVEEVSQQPILSRVRYVFSFYSIVDLLAIVPFYLSVALPHSFVNKYDEYLRMVRIVRLVKLDKYVPSITLVDDVLRLKFEPLKVAFYAAVTLWILFAAALYLCEHQDTVNGIDPVPQYGCIEDCTMSDRFQNFFDSTYYTGIHLTGDYPITTYTWPARFVNFFMVIAAVGVVSVPSALIASGFVEIVKSRTRANSGVDTVLQKQQIAGDDWYEIQYRALAGTEPLPSRFGPLIDRWQIAVNEFLNGKKHSSAMGGHIEWTTFSYSARIFIFVIIVGNVIAVLLESIPWIDKQVGNGQGNFFDVFEFISVMIFATEYLLRLFCAPKSREALYSTAVYATTFFGIVDFLSTAPWFIEQALLASGVIQADGDYSKIFRIFRIFRILQLEDFLQAFSKLDNVFRASKDVLKATGLLALIIWVGCSALFLIFEENHPNWRQCDGEIPLHSDDFQGNSTTSKPGCYDFPSTAACNEYYPGMCSQVVFTDMPNALYYTAVFLGGEWGVVDFTWPGRIVALFLCVFGIGLYAIPIGTLFNSFGAVLGLAEEDDEEDSDDKVDDETKLPTNAEE